MLIRLCWSHPYVVSPTDIPHLWLQVHTGCIHKALASTVFTGKANPNPKGIVSHGRVVRSRNIEDVTVLVRFEQTEFTEVGDVLRRK